MHNNIIKIICLVCFTLSVGCQLPNDKIRNFPTPKGFITGISTPKKVRSQDNYIFIQDSKGLYMANLQMMDLSNAELTEKDLIYKNDKTYKGYNGDIMDFAVDGDYVYIAAYKSADSKYYIIRHTIYLGENDVFQVPGTNPVTHITVTPDYLILAGRAYIALKGKTSGDDFDTTADYIEVNKNGSKNNLTMSPSKPVGIKTDSGYAVFLISMETDQCGIRLYDYDKDTTSDSIEYVDEVRMDLFPFDLVLKKGTNDTVIASGQGSVLIIDMSADTTDDIIHEIPIGSDNGALRTIEYGDKLVTLYGYKITANKYDKTAYDIYAYWCGAMVIENPYEKNTTTIKKNILIDGWATDCAVYEDYLFVANQVKNCINIYDLQ